jgi:hypothetical protein
MEILETLDVKLDQICDSQGWFIFVNFYFVHLCFSSSEIPGLSEKAFRLNDKKLMTWLKCKTIKLKKFFEITHQKKPSAALREALEVILDYVDDNTRDMFLQSIS